MYLLVAFSPTRISILEFLNRQHVQVSGSSRFDDLLIIGWIIAGPCRQKFDVPVRPIATQAYSGSVTHSCNLRYIIECYVLQGARL